jgi:CubicO group peptidase (beta-lactamase class C family)
LIIKDDEPAYKAYFGDMNSNKIHLNYSVTKSIASILIGILHQDGLLPELDTPILDVLTVYPIESLSNPDTRKSDITIRHVLQMRSGIEWDEFSAPYTSNLNPAVAIVGASDWIKFVLDKSIFHDPGSRFAYNSGCSILLGGLIQELTGKPASTFAKERLLNPLGITNYQWLEGPNGVTNIGFGISLRSRDMAKIGRLNRQNGIWEGNVIIIPE